MNIGCNNSECEFNVRDKYCLLQWNDDLVGSNATCHAMGHRRIYNELIVHYSNLEEEVYNFIRGNNGVKRRDIAKALGEDDKCIHHRIQRLLQDGRIKLVIRKGGAGSTYYLYYDANAVVDIPLTVVDMVLEIIKPRPHGISAKELAMLIGEDKANTIQVALCNLYKRGEIRKERVGCGKESHMRYFLNKKQ